MLLLLAQLATTTTVPCGCVCGNCLPCVTGTTLVCVTSTTELSGGVIPPCTPLGGPCVLAAGNLPCCGMASCQDAVCAAIPACRE